MFFRIDNIIEFRPNSLSIINLKKPEVSVTLPAPASRCLQYLIEHSPNIVTQEELITHVWGGEGMLIPKNTLYQNISIIRREIRRVGCDKKIITTVSRKGFVISGFVINKGVQHEGIVPEDFKCNSFPGSNRNSSTVRLRIIAVFFLSLLLCLMVSSFLNMFIDPRPSRGDFFRDYSFVKKIDNCMINYNKEDDSVLLSIFSVYKSHFDCSTYPYVYITVDSISTVNTIVVCKKRFIDKIIDNCASLYYSIGSDR